MHFEFRILLSKFYAYDYLIIDTYRTREVLYYSIIHHSFMGTVHFKAIPLLLAQRQVAEILSISDVNENGKPVMRSSRCEGVAELLGGKRYQLVCAFPSGWGAGLLGRCPRLGLDMV